MEIKTCEEFVLAELSETKENLLKLGEANCHLREENASLKSDLRYVLSLIKDEDNTYRDCKNFKLDIDENDIYGDPVKEYLILKNIFERYK